MARMMPPEFGDLHRNAAEEIVFALLRDQTPDSWVGLHHVGLPRHPRKPIAEVDFVVIAEPGIFCLEVKGGGASRRNGTWYAGTRELKESPFLQVGSAAASLRGTVETLHPFVFGYGCVFPHCRFDVEDPEVLPEVVYDDDMSTKPFADYVQRLGAYWRERYPRSSILRPNDIGKVAHALQGDFDLVESVMPSVRAAGRRLIAYTDEQARAVAGLREERQVVVRGGAGTGKTVLGIGEAVRLAEAGQKTLFTCFNKAVGAYLSDSVERPALSVAHLDSLISDLIKAGGTEGKIPDDVAEDERMELFRPLAAIEAVDRLGEDSRFDALVVDEGQDLLTQPRVDVLNALLRGGLRDGVWRVFWDPLQALFMPDGRASLGLLSSGGARPVTYPLALNCRNTVDVATRVEHLSGVELEEISLVEGPEPTDIEWRNTKDEAKRLRAAVKELLEAGIPRESITVLSPRRFVSSVASGIDDAAVPIRDRSGEMPEADPAVIAFSTIQAFKGLESEAVLLVDVDDLDSDRMRSLLYVGASRARTVLGTLRSDVTRETFTRRLLEHARRSSPSASARAVDFL